MTSEVKKDELCNKLRIQLTKRRDVLGDSQVSVARRAKYRKPNLTSMIEKGISSIPISRSNDIADGYQLNRAEFAKAVICSRYPEVWELFVNILKESKFLTKEQLDEFAKSGETFINRIDRLPRRALK